MNTGSQFSKIKGWRIRHPFILFLAGVILQMILFYILYYNAALQDTIFFHVVNLYASLSSKILNVLGYGTTVLNDTISSSQFSVGIKKGCDALEPMALVTAGMLAFPASWRSKIKGLIIGLSFLFLLNIIRIVSLFLVGIYNHDLFETMHIDVWQIIFIILGTGYWILWARGITNKVKPA
ncbi:MAG: archaeosortase/exosortase family protein [Bacteroidetes bacterium]|nr:archaeosortase/exosortase family protein [Bacteroidota bacterium]